jgi:hypothetical protein
LSGSGKLIARESGLGHGCRDGGNSEQSDHHFRHFVNSSSCIFSLPFRD